MFNGLTPPLERLLARLTVRSSLDRDEREAILDLDTQARLVKAGFNVSSPENDDGKIHIVASGLVCSFEQTRDGRRQITALHIHGDATNLPTLMLAEAACEVNALSDSMIVTVSRADLLALVTTSPAIAMALWRDCALDACVLAKWAVNLGRKSARARLAHLFCEMACRYEQTGSRVGLCFELLMTQEDLGDALAMTSVHLNRVLQGLRRDNVVEMRGRMVELLDWNAMVRAAEFDRRYLCSEPIGPRRPKLAVA